MRWAARLALFGALCGAGALAFAMAAPRSKTAELVAAAKACGFDDPKFTLQGDIYLINETIVSGWFNGPVPPAGQRSLERSALLEKTLMPCLHKAADRLGVRVGYEKRIMVN